MPADLDVRSINLRVCVRRVRAQVVGLTSKASAMTSANTHAVKSNNSKILQIGLSQSSAAIGAQIGTKVLWCLLKHNKYQIVRPMIWRTRKGENLQPLPFGGQRLNSHYAHTVSFQLSPATTSSPKVCEHKTSPILYKKPCRLCQAVDQLLRGYWSRSSPTRTSDTRATAPRRRPCSPRRSCAKVRSRWPPA